MNPEKYVWAYKERMKKGIRILEWPDFFGSYGESREAYEETWHKLYRTERVMFKKGIDNKMHTREILELHHKLTSIMVEKDLLAWRSLF